MEELTESNGKVRMRDMLLQEALAVEKRNGAYTKTVRLIRRKCHGLSVADMADMFEVSTDNCISVIDTINTHPDWNDERVAEEIDWNRQ